MNKQGAPSGGFNALTAALGASHAHQQATGHEARVVLSINITNRSADTKRLTQGGCGRFQAECRRNCGVVA